MNSSADMLTTQLNIEMYIQKNYHGKIDAMKWESLADGTHLLILYSGGEQIALLFIKSELQSYFSEGWEQRLQEKAKDILKNGR